MSQSGSGDTGTVSIEISVPTDLTVTSEADSEDHESNVRRKAETLHRLTSDKIELQRSIEKLKLQVKELEAEAMSSKAQFASTLHQKDLECEAKLSEKQTKTNKLEAELLTTRDSLKSLKEKAAKELAHLLQKCYEFQENQARLSVKHEEIKSSLDHLVVTEDAFQSLHKISKDKMNLQQYVTYRICESVIPLKARLKESDIVKTSLENAISTYEKELEQRNKANAKLLLDVNELHGKVLEYGSKYDQVIKESKMDDYRIQNFDRIKKERDNYEEELNDLTKFSDDFKLTISVLKNEKKLLLERNDELKTQLKNQSSELSKFRHEYYDIKKEFDKLKELHGKTSSRLAAEQQRCEEIHDKLLTAKTELASFTNKFQDSQSMLKDMEEKYQKILHSESQTKDKMEDCKSQLVQTQTDMRNLQFKYQKEVDALRHEIEAMRISYNNLTKTYNEFVEKNFKLQKESDIRHISNQNSKTINIDEIMKLNQEVYNLQRELNQYKSIEDEYLTSLKAYASSTNDEGLLASNIMKGKLSRETISLTRKLLKLERENMEACSIIKTFTSTLEQMRASLLSYKTALSLAQKPPSELLNKIKTQEEQILTLEDALNACQESKSLHEANLKRCKEDLQSLQFFIDEAKSNTEDTLKLKQEILRLGNWISNLNVQLGTPQKDLCPAIVISKQR